MSSGEGAMPKLIQGDLSAKGLKFGIIAARFNDFITTKLLDGAVDALERHGAADGDIEVVKVPGSFEIPFAAKSMAQSTKYDAIICLGNSFTHLFSERDRRRALAEFYACLRHDGVLILDQRNYDSILDHGFASKH